MKKKETRGGSREGSGAKKKPNGREPITLYIAKDIMKKKGGKEALRDELYRYVGQR